MVAPKSLIRKTGGRTKFGRNKFRSLPFASKMSPCIKRIKVSLVFHIINILLTVLCLCGRTLTSVICVDLVASGPTHSDLFVLLTEFEVHTVSYGPSMVQAVQAHSARAINRKGKKRGSITYGTDRENEVSKIFIISLLCV